MKKILLLGWKDLTLAFRDRAALIVNELLADAGAVPQADVLRATAEAADARLQLISAQTRVPGLTGELTTAMGRAYLAATSDGERHELMDRIRELDEFAWPKIREGIEAGMKEYRELGCCCSFGAWQKDVNAIAVAFRPGPGMPPMSINCGGPAFPLSPGFLMNQARPRPPALAGRLEGSLGSA